MAKGVEKRRQAKAWTKTVSKNRSYAGGGCACNRVRSLSTRNVRLWTERTRLRCSAVLGSTSRSWASVSCAEPRAISKRSESRPRTPDHISRRCWRRPTARRAPADRRGQMRPDLGMFWPKSRSRWQYSRQPETPVDDWVRHVIPCRHDRELRWFPRHRHDATNRRIPAILLESLVDGFCATGFARRFCWTVLLDDSARRCSRPASFHRPRRQA